MFPIVKASSSTLVFKKIAVQEDLAPVIIAQNTEALKYVQPNVQISEIVPWLKDYTEGKLKPFIKCEAIPETNDEPVKVVVAKSLRDMVLDSKNNVLLEIYEPGVVIAINSLLSWTK